MQLRKVIGRIGFEQQLVLGDGMLETQHGGMQSLTPQGGQRLPCRLGQAARLGGEA